MDLQVAAALSASGLGMKENFYPREGSQLRRGVERNFYQLWVIYITGGKDIGEKKYTRQKRGKKGEKSSPKAKELEGKEVKKAWLGQKKAAAKRMQRF